MFSALPDGRVAIAHLEAPVDTVSASLYAGWLHDTGMAQGAPTIRARMVQQASELRAVVRAANANKITHTLRGDPEVLKMGRAQ